MANGANAVINRTLPTVVGMGVTAHAIDTLWGRGASRSRSVKGRTRKFGGKTYHLANAHSSKRVAEKDAEAFRAAGHSARVVRINRKYAVYVR